jgi:23S rRNA (cytidine1920-2'-O)/16S rRNA (cytidine1409-2'-O)-methyltransferase
MLEQGLVKTRSQARMLIEQGDVEVNGRPALKSGQSVEDKDQISIVDRTLYVGRGAYKLEKAIEEFKIDFTDKSVADIGASTGGFTQVCLNAGAKRVFAIDVGKGQLAEILKNDERVVNLEGVNAKYPFEFEELKELEEKVDAFVMDVSFISIKKIIANAFAILKPEGFGVALIKPQFEAGPERVGKRGIVSDQHRTEILEETLSWLKHVGISVEKLVDSPISGKTGNIEYLALVKNIKI